jgi:hypothetical protein
MSKLSKARSEFPVPGTENPCSGREISLFGQKQFPDKSLLLRSAGGPETAQPLARKTQSRSVADVATAKKIIAGNLRTPKLAVRSLSILFV